jgi:hypothetical protein
VSVDAAHHVSDADEACACNSDEHAKSATELVERCLTMDLSIWTAPNTAR